MKTIILAITLSVPILSFTNCNSAKKTSAQPDENSTQAVITNTKDSLENRYWKLVEIMGQPIPDNNNKEPFMQFDAKESRVNGTGGCNSFFGTYELKNMGRIKFNQIGSTQMACPNMETETALYKVLETTDSYLVIGDTLLLHRARMAPLAKFIEAKQ